MLSTSYFMHLKCSLIKIFVLLLYVGNVAHVLEVNYCLQTTVTRMVCNYSRLLVSYRDGFVGCVWAIEKKN